MKRRTAQKDIGFTLVELLVVIAIIAILAAVVLLIINPLELTRRGRDSARLADMASLQNVINIAAQEATGSGTTAILCAGGLTGGSCSGRSTDNGANVRKTDGTGWVKTNLAGQKSVQVPTLPVDPVNNSTYHYTYCSDGNTYELDTVLESSQFASKMANDGGDENATDTTGRYEVGSSLTLINPSGLCNY